MKTLPALILAVLLGVATGQSAAAQPASAKARLQRLEDQAEIQRLLIDYGRLLDARDWRGFSLLFADKGQWVGGFGTATGPAEIEAMMVKMIGTRPGANYHLLSNFEIDVHGDSATAWSRWSFIGVTADNKPAILFGGHYIDSLVREHGHWRIARREAPADVPAPADQGMTPAAK